MKMRLSFIILGILISLPIAAQDWTWAGFEIVGTKSLSRAQVESYFPIKVGEKYKQDSEAWKAWCDDFENKTGVAYAECSAVRYVDFKAYFVVDIVEKGSEKRIQYRNLPTGSIPLASTEILSLYKQLYDRLFELFNKGKVAAESADKGYLDYDDPEMHKVIERLVQLTPSFRENILEVLEKDKNIIKRQQAANLLNWTINKLPDTVVRANRLLDDPDMVVRNNISRFTMHFLEHLNTKAEREEVVDHLLVQLDRPSHADRNKAIFNLLFLAQKNPEIRPLIKLKGETLIRYISQASVLNNVREPALQLLKML